MSARGGMETTQRWNPWGLCTGKGLGWEGKWIIPIVMTWPVRRTVMKLNEVRSSDKELIGEEVRWWVKSQIC